MRTRAGLGLLAVGAAVISGVSGCSSVSRDAGVTGVVRSFVDAVQGGDGAAACGLLTIDARQSASGATDITCAEAIMSIREQGVAVREVQVWGDAAQVKVGGDVLFLRRTSNEWRVSAAGCKPRPPGPYDCMVGG